MMNNLANCYRSLRKTDLALDLKLRSLEGWMRVLGVAHDFTRGAIGEYCSWVQQAESSVHRERARRALEEGLERARREFGPKSRAALAWTDFLATVLVLFGRSDEAIALVDGLPKDLERPGGAELHLRTYLALVLREHGRLTEARRYLEGVLTEALRLQKQATEPNQLVEEVRGLAQLLLASGRPRPGHSPEERPHAPFTIDAPFRADSPRRRWPHRPRGVRPGDRGPLR